MATLIEKLWRCKSANGGRQNNCPPTGPHTLPKKGEFRFKRVSEGAGEERERHPFCLFFDDSFLFRFSVMVAEAVAAGGRSRRGGGQERLQC